MGIFFAGLLTGLLFWAVSDWNRNIADFGKVTDEACTATTPANISVAGCPGLSTLASNSSDGVMTYLGAVCSGHGQCNASTSTPTCICHEGYEIGVSGSCDTLVGGQGEPLTMLPLIIAAIGFVLFCLVLSGRRLHESLRISSAEGKKEWTVDGTDVTMAVIAAHLKIKEGEQAPALPQSTVSTEVGSSSALGQAPSLPHSPVACMEDTESGSKAEMKDADPDTYHRE